MMNVVKVGSLLVLALLLGGLASPSPLVAQEAQARPDLRGTVGWSGFLDEDTLRHLVLGGSLLWPVTGSLSVGPSVLYMRNTEIPELDQDVVVRANVVWHLVHRGRFHPYVVGGGGILLHRADFRGSLADEVFWSKEASVGGGAGLRIDLGDRLFLAPEIRVGWEPLLEATVALGFDLR